MKKSIIMKKYSWFVLFVLLFFSYSYFFTEADSTPDLLKITSYTGPGNGEKTLSDTMDFFAAFDAPKISKEVNPPNKYYNIFFQATCLYQNKEEKAMPVGDSTSGAHYILSNKSKFEASGKNISLEWKWQYGGDSNTICPSQPYAPIGVRWTLKEIDSNGKEVSTYLTQSFSFKIYKKGVSGFYYLYLNDKSYLNYSDKSYPDKKSCDDAFDKFLKDNPKYTRQTNCEYYDDIPFIPSRDPVVYVSSDTSAVENKTIYNFLAPIGKIKCMDSTGTNKDCISNNIGEYLNFIFKLGIGLSAALAVLMLILGGIMYMGEESIFGKMEAKGRMKGAIFGLLITLAAWALLNTINPDLTGKNGASVSSAEITVTPLFDIGYNDPKKPNGESIYCTPVTNGSCSVENLKIALGVDTALATSMSKICNMESRGVSQESKTDICKPGDKSFSFGLFQVNLSANGILAGSDCVDLFDRSVTGKDAIEPKYSSGYTCSLLAGKESQYNTCKNRLLDKNTNLAIAKSLLNNSKGINNWSGDKKYCASAFQ